MALEYFGENSVLLIVFILAGQCGGKPHGR
jgi:hypothetical protein